MKNKKVNNISNIETKKINNSNNKISDNNKKNLNNKQNNINNNSQNLNKKQSNLNNKNNHNKTQNDLNNKYKKNTNQNTSQKNNIRPYDSQNNQKNGIKPYVSHNNQKNNIKPNNNQSSKNNNTKKTNNQKNSKTNITSNKNQNNLKKNNKGNGNKTKPKQNQNQNNFKNSDNANTSKNKTNNPKPINKISKTEIKEVNKLPDNKKIENNNEKNDKQEKSEVVIEKKNNIKIYILIIILFIILSVIGMFVSNIFSNKINKNVYIEDINVSKLEYSEAKEKIENQYKNIVKEDVCLIYQDNEYKINLEDIKLFVLSDEAAIKARNIGRNDNILFAAREYYNSILGQEQKIDLEFDYNKEILYSKIKEIEKNFYKEVKQYSYTIEDNKLKITNGTSGIKIEYEKLANDLIDLVRKKDLKNKIEIPIQIESPEPIDVEKIHDEVFVEVANAYYEKEPFKIYNEVIGVDFDKEALLQMIELEPEKEQYIIDLQITEPQIKVDNLGLYNDVLGQCRTAYVNNPNRTTNLRLAANKINGKILMPGESFSYNDVVGERTVAAGYRNAAIYINGEVEDGLAGGICQISSTLYDAVVYANLQVDERFNHARVPSYVTAGRDATVYWGSKDFKFTNNRNYPIKIELTVNSGYASAVIYGMKTENEFDISFASSVVSRYNGYMVVKTYKVYKQNGVEIKRELISTDSYKV